MVQSVERREDATRVRGGRFLIVTGMNREAACVTGDGLTTICSGADVHQLRAALADVSHGDFAGVVSFGLAGGLCHSLRPGDMVIAQKAVAHEGHYDAHAPLSSVLREGLASSKIGRRVVLGAIAGVDAPVMHPEAKASLRRRTNAIAVDMESHVAAEYADRRGLPVVAVRAITDPASRALPPLAANAVDKKGSVNVRHVVRELKREPRQIGDLVRAGLDARAAFATLGRCGPLLGPLLRLMLADLGETRDILVEDVLGGPLLV